MKEGNTPVLLELRFYRRQRRNKTSKSPVQVWGVLRLAGAGGTASMQGQHLSRGTAVSSALAAGARRSCPGSEGHDARALEASGSGLPQGPEALPTA